MVSMLLLSSEEKRPVMPRVLGCRACEQITSGDCGMHGPVIIPLSPPGWLGRAIEDAKPCECLALRAEVDRLKLKVVELSRGAWVEDTAERDALRAEVGRLRGEYDRGMKVMRDAATGWMLTELDAEHHGDCTQEPQPCLRCFAEDVIGPAYRKGHEARLAALTDPATVERVARAIRDAFCRVIPDHGRTPCVVEVGDREAARAALAALGDVKPPATRNLP